MSMTMTSNAPLPSLVTLTAESTSLCLIGGAASMPADDRERWFRRYGSANALRQWRLDDRDAAIRQLAALYDAASGRALARAIHTDLRRHRIDTAARTDDRRVLLRKILVLIGAGKIPGVVQLKSILSGGR